MEQAELKEVQAALLGIAEELKRVCEQCGIRYFMDSGTLLGAIRHGGFIPWDDDMDFGMLREEYARFIETAPGFLRKDYFLQTWDNDPQFPYAYAKLRKIGTVYEEALTDGLLNHNELYIDIFPFDHYPDSCPQRIAHRMVITLLRHAYLVSKGVKPWRTYSRPLMRAAVYLKYLPARLYSRMHTAEEIKSRHRKEAVRFNGAETGWLCEHAGNAPYGRQKVPAGCFASIVMHSFEDTEFPMCADYDTFLRCYYGEYMIPPKNPPAGSHGIVKISL